MKKLKKETEIWNFINKKRKKREWVENDIKGEEWKRHFMKLLGGAAEMETIEDENKARKEEETKEEQVEDRFNEVEIGRAVKKMKLKKACSIDGIPMEAWKYAEMKKGLTMLLNQIWKEGAIPKDWKISIVVPLYKRRDKEQTDNYRGISLLCSAYKIYAEILNTLEEEAESKKSLPESQAGFRRGRSTTDNIFVLNHLVQREKGKEKKAEKVYALFVDLKAAFDNVDREKLWRILEDKNINRKLIRRIQEIYEETIVKIRHGIESTEEFWVKKGVRQGCASAFQPVHSGYR